MAQIFVSAVAHFFVVVGGSKIHERPAHFFIDIYMEDCRHVASGFSNPFFSFRKKKAILQMVRDVLPARFVTVL